MQAEALDSSKNQGIAKKNHNVPQITVEHFSFEELHFVSKRKGGKAGTMRCRCSMTVWTKRAHCLVNFHFNISGHLTINY